TAPSILRFAESSIYKVFEQLVKEEEVLANLYSPLKERLAGAQGALGKLAFVTERTVDVKGWCDQGEDQFDLRSGNVVRGRGSIQKLAEETPCASVAHRLCGRRCDGHGPVSGGDSKGDEDTAALDQRRSTAGLVQGRVGMVVRHGSHQTALRHRV